MRRPFADCRCRAYPIPVFRVFVSTPPSPPLLVKTKKNSKRGGGAKPPPKNMFHASVSPPLEPLHHLQRVTVRISEEDGRSTAPAGGVRDLLSLQHGHEGREVGDTDAEVSVFTACRTGCLPPFPPSRRGRPLSKPLHSHALLSLARSRQSRFDAISAHAVVISHAHTPA